MTAIRTRAKPTWLLRVERCPLRRAVPGQRCLFDLHEHRCECGRIWVHCGHYTTQESSTVRHTCYCKADNRTRYNRTARVQAIWDEGSKLAQDRATLMKYESEQ